MSSRVGGTDPRNLWLSPGWKDWFLINYNFIVESGRFIKMLRSVQRVFSSEISNRRPTPIAEAFYQHPSLDGSAGLWFMVYGNISIWYLNRTRPNFSFQRSCFSGYCYSNASLGALRKAWWMAAERELINFADRERRDAAGRSGWRVGKTRWRLALCKRRLLLSGSNCREATNLQSLRQKRLKLINSVKSCLWNVVTVRDGRVA